LQHKQCTLPQAGHPPKTYLNTETGRLTREQQLASATLGWLDIMHASGD